MILQLPPQLLIQGLSEPRLASIEREMATALQNLECVRLDTVLDRLLDLSEEPLPKNLVDELANYVCASNKRDRTHIRRKSIDEAALIECTTGIVDKFASGSCNFDELLIGVSTLAFGRVQTFRTVPAGVVRDTFGRQILFPSPADGSALRTALGNEVRSRLTSEYATSAILAMVGIIHSHRFADGNGRIARIVCAAILRPGSGSSADVPMMALQCLSYPSFLIRIRRAQCFGDWFPIVSHMACTLECLRSVTATIQLDELRPTI